LFIEYRSGCPNGASFVADVLKIPFRVFASKRESPDLGFRYDLVLGLRQRRDDEALEVAATG
jgi:hypothetical protein